MRNLRNPLFCSNCCYWLLVPHLFHSCNHFPEGLLPFVLDKRRLLPNGPWLSCAEWLPGASERSGSSSCFLIPNTPQSVSIWLLHWATTCTEQEAGNSGDQSRSLRDLATYLVLHSTPVPSSEFNLQAYLKDTAGWVLNHNKASRMNCLVFQYI